MNHPLSHPEVQAFIRQHETEDESNLLLRHKHIEGIPISLIVQQISGRKKAKEKLPSLYQRQGIVYPPSLNVEQCSSEETAAFKVSILKEENINPSGKALDLTMGFGIDAISLSRYFKQLSCVEPDAGLLEITQHNHKVLQADNIVYQNGRAEDVIEDANASFELIYADPSRRTAANKKVFQLRDCLPDVTSLLQKMLSLSDHILIKASPLLDIKQGLQELQHTKKVYVLSVHNECKELLFFCNPNHHTFPEIITVNRHGDIEERFSFTYQEEAQAPVEYAAPLKYLYEPNASVLKAGAFKSIANRFQIQKIHPNTHLYTSDACREDFPGRIFEVYDMIKADAKAATGWLPDRMANVITRNYPLSAAALKQKLKIRDGGSKYIIGFSGQDRKFICVARRLK